MERRFASIQHPDKYGYTYDSDAWRGGDISPKFQMYETYGHGNIQHSSAWPISTEYLTDYLASIAAAMITETEEIPLAQGLVYDFNQRPKDEDIAFCASVVYKADPAALYREKKRRYYSVAERKITSNPAKEHDKRYHEVKEWCNGEATAVYRMLIPEGMKMLEMYLYAKAIGDWMNAQPDMSMSLPARFLQWRGFEDYDAARNLDSAFSAVLDIVRCYSARKQAERTVDWLRRTLAPKVQESTEEVA